MSNTRQVVLIVNAALPYNRKIIQGVSDYAEEVGNWALYVEEDPLRRLPDFRVWPFDGTIANLFSRKTQALPKGLKTPLVRVGGGEGWGDPALANAYFEPDNEATGRLAAEHLIDQGYKRLAFYSLSRNQIAPWPKDRPAWPEERAEAFKKRADEAGLPCSVYIGRHSAAHGWEDLHLELSAWLDSLEKPVGLMVCNDAWALHVLTVCQNMGVRVPEDIAVIGVDNDEMLCELSHPPLSSVQHGIRVGYQAAALLDQLMSGNKAPQLRFVLQPEGVVTRRSTDPLLIEDAQVAAAVRFIREHASDRIQVPDVVQAVNVSRSTLRTRFKAVMGRTIHAEIQRVQLEHAKQLVTASSLPLKQVATRSGFKHTEYMITLFRQQFGQTPAEYRKRSRRSDLGMER